MLFVGVITLLGALASDNVFEGTAATGSLAMISFLAHLAALVSIPGVGILFALLFTILLVYVALLVRDLVFALNTERPRRYA